MISLATTSARGGRATMLFSVCLPFIFCLSIYGDAFPYRVPLFFSIVFLASLWFVFVRRRFVLSLDLGFLLFMGSVLFYLIAVLRTGTIFHEIQRDLQNIAGLLLTILLMSNTSSASEFEVFRRNTMRISALWAALLAVLGLYKYYLMGIGVKVALIWIEGRPYPWGASLVVDYNFYAFAMLVGAISSLYCFREARSGLTKTWYLTCSVVCLAATALAGSRRGWVTEAIFLAALTIAGVIVPWNFVLRLRRDPRRAVQSLKTLAAVLILSMFCLPIIGRYVWHAANQNTQEARQHNEDLKFRFSTLAAPHQAFAERSTRWEYSLQMINERTPFEILFGTGFDYLPRFATRFDVRGGGEDYPHNPLISTLLYSGVLGAMWVFLYLGATFLTYWKYKSVDMYFFLVYFTALWFILPSFNTLFSGKLLVVSMVVPWLLQRVCAPFYAKSARSRSEPIYA